MAWSYYLPVLLCLCAAFCLLSKREGLRGAGRIADGLAWFFVARLLATLHVSGHTPTQIPEHLFDVLSGASLLIVLSGARKLYRSGTATQQAKN